MPSGSGQRGRAATEPQRDGPVGCAVDVGRSEPGDLRDRPAVEQQHTPGEPVAQIDVLVVQQAAQGRETLLVGDRLARRNSIVPRDGQATGDARSREPDQEQADAATHPGTSGDPLIDEVLSQISELELILVQPEHERDRLADERPRVLLRGLARVTARPDDP